MAAFDYPDAPDPIRADLVAAYRGAWEHVAAPGTWLCGAERVAVAEETRRATSCALCREREQALSPNAVQGEHEHTGRLAPALVEAVHRVTSDAARLSQSWLEGLRAQGLDAEAYVEALGVAVLTLSIDRFHHALGLPLEPLPEPRPGEPSRERPEGVVDGEAWVPMLDSRRAAALIGMRAPTVPYVLRALSLVPAEVRAWRAVSSAQYLDEDHMLGFGKFRALDRSQIELVAGRVSALNECFY
jgi:alkylhydroperoxidase family enzyme